MNSRVIPGADGKSRVIHGHTHDDSTDSYSATERTTLVCIDGLRPLLESLHYEEGEADGSDTNAA
jgi:hypothetical protein